MLIKCVEWVIWTRKGTLARSLLMLMVGNWMDHTANLIFRFSSFKISIESGCFATEIHFLIHFYLITSTGLKNASIGHIFNRQKIKRENSWFIF